MYLSKWPNHPIYIEQLAGHMQYHLIFELLTREKYPVYMSHPISLEPDQDTQIVFIDGERFLKLWQNLIPLQQPQLSFGNESVWRADYKYHWPEKHFAQGKSNPVPLAKVGCHQYIRHEVIEKKWLFLFKKRIGYKEHIETACSFTDGITRTIWLLANGVTAFPVYVYNKTDAQLLAKHAGISNNSYYDLVELNQELRRLTGLTLNIYEDLYQ